MNKMSRPIVRSLTSSAAAFTFAVRQFPARSAWSIDMIRRIGGLVVGYRIAAPEPHSQAVGSVGLAGIAAIGRGGATPLSLPCLREICPSAAEPSLALRVGGPKVRSLLAGRDRSPGHRS
jgi:hypothetical protein